MSEQNTYTVTAEAKFGGFIAERVGNGGLILVRAAQWKGKQPRIVLDSADSGYREWAELLDAHPTTKQVSFPVNDAACNLADQWLSH